MSLGLRSQHDNVLIACCVILVVSMTTAMPMKEIIERALKKTGDTDLHHRRLKRAVTRENCTRPSDSQLIYAFEQINSQINSTQFLQPPKSGLAIGIPSGEKSRIIMDENEARSCPSSLTRDSGAVLAHRSLCPYTLDVLQLPGGYYPHTLTWATCKCQKCVQNTAYACEEVMTPIAVLKPVHCFQGLQKFEEELISIRTACICAIKESKAKEMPTEDFDWAVE